LAYCQEVIQGFDVIKDLPGHRIDADSPTGKKHDLLYMQCKQWLDGDDVQV